MPTNKEIFNSKMNALADSINVKAGSTGAKDLDALKTAVDGITVGVDTSSDTVAAGVMLSGYTAHDSTGTQVTGNIASQAAQTITPTTSDQTIAAGKYLAGAQTIKGDANLVAANIAQGVTIFGVQGTHSGGGGTKPSYLISDGDTVSTIYFNKEYALASWCALLTGWVTDPVSGLDVVAIGLGYLYVVDLTGGNYALVWNDGVTITPIWASTAVPAYGVTTAGWQIGYFTPSSSISVSMSSIIQAFQTIMDSVVAKDDIAFGDHGGSQPQLNAPSISISQMTLTITNPSTNGNFVTGYKIFADGTQIGTTSNTTYDLSGLSANTASITVKAVGTNFIDSAASTAVTFYKYFTVNMYDDDKTTLLQTQSVRYGLMPTYTPTKTGYAFEYWTDINGTQVTEITANTNLYAVWISAVIYIRAGQYTLRTSSQNTAILDYTAEFNYRRKNAQHYDTGMSIQKGSDYQPNRWFVINNKNKSGAGDTAVNIGYATVSGTPTTITWTKATAQLPITVETDQQVDEHEYDFFNALFESVT